MPTSTSQTVRTVQLITSGAARPLGISRKDAEFWQCTPLLTLEKVPAPAYNVDTHVSTWTREGPIMEEVGVRELKQRASQLLQRVRERKEVITITHRGRAVARLVPVEEVRSKQMETAAVWAEMDDLAQEIGARWPTGVSALEAVQEQRR